HGMSLAPYFTKEFWQRNYPLWQDYDAWRSLGLPELNGDPSAPKTVAVANVVAPPATVGTAPAASTQGFDFSQLLYGLFFGVLGYIAFGRVSVMLKNRNKLPEDSQ
ncbi:MAG: copper oxidase, partial [Methylococcales bacterium]|nr:copper oxidase [Methylococcales bacterium]